MWLLNSHTQELNEVISHRQAPPYAILSHTWGNEEVSFRDWKRRDSEEVRKKEGFHKIISLCQKAAADGHEWVWVDTCCIDKRSSAELSEAINSMFQWYSNAAVCYVYLFDVSDRINKFNVANTRWVTRGWTLQELIAPREVIFFSSAWEALGTRSELSVHLADVTGIHESFLKGKSIHEASIAQRMSWAANRTTSREEDMAYCLLGIFDVNMSLIYGEGLKAFRRLQELLIQEYPDDHSLFAWGKIVNRPSNAVDDKEQLWGSKPISYDPNQVGRIFFGLLAERPKDFSDSGQIICAPSSTEFFKFERVPSASGLSRSTVDVELPVVSNQIANIMPVNVAVHLKHPPIGKQCKTPRHVSATSLPK
ncbi:heterokaryon incompatibility protein-domain-containing protein [Hypoxylon argillaceum]|nr:heterokaryon incompatibility protein-domain-containing protein [Hypoxylon argillaceum]